ncbi:DUF4864 domain-containing protein [Pseudomonas mangiferae]|uniref:DUF4440 domain-containing protein n=1 Tax=Pseudomonas mangiferae TaxID=2593654 RepID=A0A553GX44_9PSED|nr:hypothetical protein [Pseudomonas mangiferae]TRX74078.1 hypothetical protein FM069_15150 [Pseudomonas mangiferae]
MKLKTGLACAALMLLTACGTFKPKSDDQIVTDRGEQRLQALKQGDYEKAYSFMSPTYRATSSLDRFKATVGRGAAMMQDYKVGEAKCEVDTCTLQVSANYHFLDKGARVPTKPMTVPRTNLERWIKVDGDWWFVKID